MRRRKLAEIWEINGDYHLAINVGAFQLQLTGGDPNKAEVAATYEVIEALRRVVKMSDDSMIKIEKEIPKG